MAAIDEGNTSAGVRRRTVGARTGGRSERVVRDVLRAAIEELSTNGYAALRVEDVAVRASVNKTTVYRRWPTKADLVTSALRTFARHHEPIPDTGSVRGDLLILLERMVSFARTPEGRGLQRMLLIECDDPVVSRICHGLRAGIMAKRTKVVERAQQRGQLPAELDAALLLDAIFEPIITRVLRQQQEIDPATVAAFLDLALAGARGGGGRAAGGDAAGDDAASGDAASGDAAQGIGSSKCTHQSNSE